MSEAKTNFSSITTGESMTPAEVQMQKLKQMMDEVNKGDDGWSAPLVKLGDTSMASILGLNCLATAYLMSVMHLDGVKLGDVQPTVSGLFTAAFFLFISHARPLQTLSAERPHPNIFCFYVFLSLLGQFALHMLFLISSVKEAEKHMPDECIDPASEFESNMVNTVCYMVRIMIQVATFAVNYTGHPFNQSISENKPFKFALVGALVFITMITHDVFRDMNTWLQLVPLPRGLRDKLLIWAALMFLGCYTWESNDKIVWRTNVGKNVKVSESNVWNDRSETACSMYTKALLCTLDGCPREIIDTG
ncbi:probable manganese-transporting ATPase PDR2 [Tanacetum coccineum]